jgi:glutaredoxin 3
MTAIIYGTESCPGCKVAKKFLEDNHVQVEEYKVDKDESKYKEMISKTGGEISVPVIDIKGEIIIGFSPLRLKKAIGL